MNIVIFDFEVFKYDTLLGAIVLDKQGEHLYQEWGSDAIKDFYFQHKNDMWVGHNNIEYDNLILEAIVKNKDAYKTSKSVINAKFKPRCYLNFAYFDTMLNSPCRVFSLKISELAAGKAMHETDVDFDLDRPLTDEEKRLTEDYNKDDLKQTLFNFNDFSSIFKLKLDLIKEFNLPIAAVNWTEARIAGTVLGCKNIDGIEDMKVPPFIPSTMKIKNQEVIDFYLREGFRKREKLDVMICGCMQHLGSGGIHSALNKFSIDKALYFDVSGYYNLIMINYDLLPRTCPKEGKELYEYMYHEQLRLKKIDPAKRWVYKTILLAVFGAMMNKYTLLYDPQRGSLVTILGQLFLIDLLEKLEESGLCYCIQTNTDGLMIEPYDWANKDAIIKIVEEWEQRTGFTIKKETITNLWQRDVNNYVYQEGNDITVKGEALRPSWYDKTKSTDHMFWNVKEPIIIAKGVTNYLVNKIPAEETVNSMKRELQYFQIFAKKLTYNRCTFEWLDLTTNEYHVENISNQNRVFPLKSDKIRGMVYKLKERNGKEVKAKAIINIDNCFVYNDEILSDEAIDKLSTKIDWQYYIDRINERIQEFLPKGE